MNTETLLFAMIRIAVCGEAVAETVKNACTDEALQKVITLATRYDLSHLVGVAVDKLGLPETELTKRCKQLPMQAMFRYVRLNYEHEAVCKTLEEGKIPFIPLKGSVLRAWYPEAWMRTSCDMDILVHEDEAETASKLLQDKLHYIYEGRSPHDLALSTPGGEHLELHYTALEESESPQVRKIMEGIWEDAKPVEGKQYHQQISDSLFYYYHMAHMAKHFGIGGCGIRPVLDIWILNNRVAYDRKAREALLQKGGLLTFACAAEKLSEIWFSGKETDYLSAQMQKFILSGGSYGGVENRVAIQHARNGGKFQYIISRLFLPYDIMKLYYPVLLKHKWLLPFCHIARWFKRLFDGGLSRSARELKANAAISQDEELSVAQLLKYLELE